MHHQQFGFRGQTAQRSRKESVACGDIADVGTVHAAGPYIGLTRVISERPIWLVRLQRLIDFSASKDAPVAVRLGLRRKSAALIPKSDYAGRAIFVAEVGMSEIDTPVDESDNNASSSGLEFFRPAN